MINFQGFEGQCSRPNVIKQTWHIFTFHITISSLYNINMEWGYVMNAIVWGYVFFNFKITTGCLGNRCLKGSIFFIPSANLIRLFFPLTMDGYGCESSLVMESNSGFILFTNIVNRKPTNIKKRENSNHCSYLSGQAFHILLLLLRCRRRRRSLL